MAELSTTIPSSLKTALDAEVLRTGRPLSSVVTFIEENSRFPLVQFTRTGPLSIVSRSITDIIWRRANE
jgi:hypothetical protein